MNEIKVEDKVEIIVGRNTGRKGIITKIYGDYIPYLVEFEDGNYPKRNWYDAKHFKLISLIKFSYIYEI